MKNSMQRFVLVAGMISLIFSTVSTDLFADGTIRKEYTQIDQPVCHFKAFGNPWMINYNPAVNEIDFIYFGWHDDVTGEVKQIKKSSELEFLVPMRFTMKFTDNNVQLDYIYNGWRESCVARFAAKTLENLHLLPKRQHQGNPLIDVMLKAQTPTKIVLADAEALSYLVRHLQKAIVKEGISPLAQKPLLLIKFQKNNQIPLPEDVQFLTTYWEMIDQYDQDAKNFFEKTQVAINDARRDTGSAKNIGESFGEMLMRLLEKDAYGFHGKDLMANAATTLLLTATVYLAAEIGKTILKNVITTPATAKVTQLTHTAAH
jgi:hypothetical protein